MPSQADIVNRYVRATGAQRDRVAAAVARVWLEMSSWSDEATEEYLNRVIPVVKAGQRSQAVATGVYMQQLLPKAKIKLDFDELIGESVRNGVNPFDVYKRAVRTARITYSRTDLVELAVNAGLDQLLKSVEQDLQLSSTHAARASLQQAKVDVYRRVTTYGACDLCVAASDRVYHTADLLPIHTHCRCRVVPGATLPRGLQRATNADTAGEDRGLVYADNDEIGPVLDYAERTTAPQVRGAKPSVTRRTATPTQLRAIKAQQVSYYEQVIAGGAGNQAISDRLADLRIDLRDLDAQLAS